MRIPLLRLPRTRWLTCVAVLGLALFASLAAQATVAQRADALCVTPSLQGDWHNINASTTAMTRAVISFNCGDLILCDQYGNCTGGQSSYGVHVYGRCHPTDCDWGTRTAVDAGDGWIKATYAFGFKTSTVWLKTYSYYGLTYLRVYVYNDFSAVDGRTDYTTDEWFLR